MKDRGNKIVSTSMVLNFSAEHANLSTQDSSDLLVLPMVQTSKTDHFGCAQQKWCNLNLLHAMVIKFSGNQQKLLFFLNT